MKLAIYQLKPRAKTRFFDLHHQNPLFAIEFQDDINNRLFTKELNRENNQCFLVQKRNQTEDDEKTDNISR